MNNKYGYVPKLYKSFLNYSIQIIKNTGCGARKIRRKAFDYFRDVQTGEIACLHSRKESGLFLNLGRKNQFSADLLPEISNLKSAANNSENRRAFLEEEIIILKSDEINFQALLQ